MYGPPKASASTMSWSGVIASAEHLVVHDRAGEARQDEGEDLVVLRLEVEDDRGVVGRLDAVQVVQQARRAVRVGDGEVAVERELDVGRREVIAVGPLQAGRKGDRVLGRRGELRRLGQVGDDLGLVVVRVDQVREHLRLNGERAVVVRPRGVEGRDLVGGADDERLTRCGVAAGGASATTGAAGEKECRGAEGAEGKAETATPAVVQCHSATSAVKESAAPGVRGPLAI